MSELSEVGFSLLVESTPLIPDIGFTIVTVEPSPKIFEFGVQVLTYPHVDGPTTSSNWSYWDGVSEIMLPSVAYWDGTNEVSGDLRPQGL